MGPINLRHGVELRHVQHGKLGRVGTQLVGGWLEKHGVRKEAVPGRLRDDADRQAVGGVRAGKAILDEQVFALKVGQRPVVEQIEGVRLERAVHRAPADRLRAARLVHDEIYPAARARYDRRCARRAARDGRATPRDA